MDSLDDTRRTDNRANEALDWLHELLEQSRTQTRLLAELRDAAALDACMLDKIARILCMTANETHSQRLQIGELARSVEALAGMYRAAHPAEALQLDQLARLKAQLEACCPTETPCEPICRYESCDPAGGIRRGDGYSAKSRGQAPALEVQAEHRPWQFQAAPMHEDDEALPQVQPGRVVGPVVPSSPTPQVLDFRSGPAPGGSGTQEPVSFRTFASGSAASPSWPPDMSGAKGGGVVLMSGNLWLRLSTDGGASFKDLDFTTIFAADSTYGGWAGDQVIHYVPAIDCFVLYVQSFAGAKGGANQSKNVVKIAIASPADLKTHAGGKAAWRRQWHFTSDTFGLNAWMDFPDLSWGTGFLYVNTNAFTRSYDSAGKKSEAFAGRLFFELPLADMAAGRGLSFFFGLCTDALTYGSPTQNIGDENYWAAHVNNSAMRIYSSKGSDSNYFWRERELKSNWPLADTDANNVRDVIGRGQDGVDWVSEDHRIIGATRAGAQLWFAWTAGANNDGRVGGFKFPQAHVHIAKFDVARDYALVDQMQVWNPDVAFAYPSLTTNSDGEVGISLAWGSTQGYGSHAVGILGDFVVWFGLASARTSTQTSPTRFGDYLHVRLAYPDTRFFSAFGYAVLTDTSTTPPSENDQWLYVEFGRQATPGPLIK
jgi:hypothetical protein